MKRFSLALLVVVCVIEFGAPARADEAGATAVLEKAIKALDKVDPKTFAEPD